jgi:hypothetical protein
VKQLQKEMPWNPRKLLNSVGPSRGEYAEARTKKRGGDIKWNLTPILKVSFHHSQRKNTTYSKKVF